jgi:hypothetical protein
VHFDLGAAGRYAQERSGVTAPIGVAAYERRPSIDDVVDLDLEVVKGVEEGSEDRDRSGLPRFGEAVVVEESRCSSVEKASRSWAVRVSA